MTHPPRWTVPVLLTATLSGVMAIAGCSGSTGPTGDSSTTSSATESMTSAVASSTTGSAAAPGGGGVPVGAGQPQLAPVALDAADVPPGFVADSPTSPVDSYTQVQATLAGRQFAPPQCGTVSAVTAESAAQGYDVSFSRDATQEGLGEFLAPAGTPSLAELESVARSCGTVTAYDPAKDLSFGGGVQVVPAPQVAAERTLGLQNTTVITAAGKAPVTKLSFTYLAETHGTLISISASGAPGGRPVDPAQVAALFSRAVDKVNTAR